MFMQFPEKLTGKRNSRVKACIVLLETMMVCSILLWMPPFTLGGEADTGEKSTVYDSFDDFRNHFTSYIKWISYDVFLQPSPSTLNPDNKLFNIPGNFLTSEIRADFSLDMDKMFLVFKPRINASWQRWEDGPQADQEETKTDSFVYEWLVRYYVSSDLIASYGRQNLQWGPAYLLSPSNPFIQNNGQSNPKREVPGMDFATLLWVIDPSWSISTIVNTDQGGNKPAFTLDVSNIHFIGKRSFPDKGRSPIGEGDVRNQIIDILGLDTSFEPGYAIKVDFTGFKKYFSVIGSFKEYDRARLGGYGGITISDAMLLYAEASYTLGSEALYPVAIPHFPNQSILMKSKDDSSELLGMTLLGGTYTLENGMTFVLEGIYNSEGYGNEDAERYYRLRKQAADLYDVPYIRDLAKLVLYQAANTRLRLLRRHYLMAQAYRNQIYDTLNLAIRFTYNIDDGSSQLIPIAEYDIGDHIQAFLVGQYNMGPIDSEFRTLFDHSVMIGVQYTF